MRLADVNSDGRVDVVRVRDGGRDVSLNDGTSKTAALGATTPQGDAGLASELDFATTDLGHDRGVRFADVDGDGIARHRSRHRHVGHRLPEQGLPPDILEKVHAPRLGATSLAYKASPVSAWSGEAPALPVRVPVLTA